MQGHQLRQGLEKSDHAVERPAASCSTVLITWCPAEYADCYLADCIKNGCKCDPLTRHEPE